MWEVIAFSFAWCFFVWFYVMDLGVVGRCNSVALFLILFYPSLFPLSLTIQERWVNLSPSLLVTLASSRSSFSVVLP